MSNIWISSDLHLGHDNIIKYCNRPFANYKEQDEALLDNFNSVIKRGDRLYLLGDVAWSTCNLDDFFGRLNTKEVFLVWGNHDDEKKTRHKSIRWYGDYKELNVDNQKYILFHYPIRSWHGILKGSIHLYGHVHNNLPGIGRSMDVGVDTNNFYPYNLEDIRQRMLAKPIITEEQYLDLEIEAWRNLKERNQHLSLKK